MAIAYHYDPAAGYVRVVATGDVTGADIRGYFESVVREPWWRPGMRFLSDNRGVTAVPTQSELHSGALAMVQSAAYQGHARVAVLVANALQYGIARQFDSLTAEGGAEMIPFYEEAQAVDWLRRS